MTELEQVLSSLQNAVLEDVPGVSQIDQEIEEILESYVPKVAIIGVGGAGCNTVTNLWNSPLRNEQSVRLIAVNTDARQLRFKTKAHHRVLIGKTTCRGFGAGNDPSVGEAAANESAEKIKKLLEGIDLAIITCGLGGGTGSGATPVIAQIAKELGIPTMLICTLPFQAEGAYRMKNAEYAITRLVKTVNTLVLIPNDKLLSIAPNKSIVEAFKVIDDFLVGALTGIVELIYKPGIVNVDFADVLRVIKTGGPALITFARATAAEGEKAELVVKKAFNNPLLNDVKIETAKSVLINVSSGRDATLKEVLGVVEEIRNRIRMPDSEMKWGIIIDEKLEGEIRVTVLMAGVKLPYIDEEGRLLIPNLNDVGKGSDEESFWALKGIPIPTL